MAVQTRSFMSYTSFGWVSVERTFIFIFIFFWKGHLMRQQEAQCPIFFCTVTLALMLYFCRRFIS